MTKVGKAYLLISEIKGGAPFNSLDGDMEDIPYDLKIDELCRFIEAGKFKRILLQLPEGLKGLSWNISSEIERKCDSEIIVYADPSWGACDIPVYEAYRLGASLIVHYGHYPYSYLPVQRDMGVEVVYIPMEYRGEIREHLVERAAGLLRDKGCRSVAIVATAQNIRNARSLASALNERGISAFLPEVYGGVPGLIIGCDYRTLTLAPYAGQADCVVVVASGLFHALGAVLSTDKRVIQVDPHKEAVEDLEGVRESWLKKRYSVIYRALGAARWGIWLGSIYGQIRYDVAKNIAKMVEARGGSYRLFISKYVTHRELMSVDSPEIEAHVITSCPRVPIDDFTLMEYHKPVLSPGEAVMVLTGRLEPYRFLW